MSSTVAAVPHPAPQAHLPLSVRVADYSVMALAVVLGGGSIALFVWAGRPLFFPMDLSLGAALAWNALLSVLFFVQHSVMVRRAVRTRIVSVIPVRYDSAFYAIASGIVLTAVVVLYQPAGAPLFVLQGVARTVVHAAALLAVALFVWGAVALKGFDPFGLQPIREHLRHGAARDPERFHRAKQFVVRGPYRWVRHPLYTAVIVLLWADPEMDPRRLELAVLWTAWIWLGAWLEERDLVAEFGEIYREYRRKVPMLVPRPRHGWRGRVW